MLLEAAPREKAKRYRTGRLLATGPAFARVENVLIIPEG
jgi:hypothetical protein